MRLVRHSEQMPLFVQTGTLLPLAPVVQSTNELSGSDYRMLYFGPAGGEADYRLHFPEADTTFSYRPPQGSVVSAPAGRGHSSHLNIGLGNFLELDSAE